ncbi:GYF domain-containing protein [Verrucomicrobiales bacterium]|nr:GYF domain-containing protein [Verrucomicrobiales bacterium]MDC0259522.1 GYF domain-containing protein [Verrucomicrobiales bacterium]MDC0291933.1 GYF domain-containing protein [Verrucomicrobiales bacterium]MDC0312159.1 GYF domain-containing protein [bacterium]
MKWYFEKFGERQGPVSIQELVEILNRGEITLDNLVWRDGMANWTPLREADALTSEDGAEMAICAQSGKVMLKSEMMPYGDKFISPEHSDAFVQNLMETSDSVSSNDDGVLPADFSVNIGSSLSRAWTTMAQDFWPITGIALLINVVYGAASQVGGGLVAIPIFAGLYYYLLRKIRGQPAEIGDAFYGFSNGFLKFFLMNLVILGISIAALIPFFVVIFASAAVGSEEPSVLAIGGMVLTGIMILFYLYVSVAWTLAPVICFDKNLPFWDSMKLSMKAYNRQFFWFSLFFLTLVLINLLGFALLVIGLYVTVPLTLLAMLHVYEDIFGGKRSAAQQQLEG